MADIRDRFEAFDRVDVPDLWTDAQGREPRPPSDPGSYTGARKAIVILTALAVTVATTGIVVRAFHHSADVQRVTGSPKDWPATSIPQLGLTFRYPPQWRFQPFDEEVGTVGFVGAVISNTGLVFRHPRVRNGVTTAWDMRGLPAAGVAISIEHIAGGPPPPSSPPPDTPLPLNLADATLVPHLTKPSFTPPPGRSEERYLAFTLGGEFDGVRVFFGPSASAATRAAVADVVASISRATPTSSVTWPPAIHAFHPPTTRAASKACPTEGSNFKRAQRRARPGETEVVSGPVYYRDEAGGFVWYAKEHPGQDYQAWWNLAPGDYGSVSARALSIAKGHPYEPSGSGPQMLGDDIPNGACSISVRFTVPDVAAGTFPVTIVVMGGRGSTTYAWFPVTVSTTR